MMVVYLQLTDNKGFVMKDIRIYLISFILLLISFNLFSEVIQLGDNYYAAGVYSDEFEYYAAPYTAGKQRQSNWCWAACIQMVLNFHGIVVTQEQIVERVFGDQINTTADPATIMYALSGWGVDVYGNPVTIHASSYNLTGPNVVTYLAYKWPLIVGLDVGETSHAFVLTAVYYSVDEYNYPYFHSVVLRDPWPENPSRIELSWDEFINHLIFATSVYVQRYENDKIKR
jgi:hypothetical protein